MFGSRSLVSLLILSLGFAAAGCRTNLLGGEDAPMAQQPAAPPAPVATDGVRTSYADVVERSSPAVVRIEAEHKSRGQAQQFPFDDFFRQMPMPQNRVERGLGSGVLVSADGTILTNNHVIDGAERITIQMSNDKTFEAKVVGADKPSDLAVLKIEAQNMPFLTLGNSDSVRVGDIVLAIGNPLGIGQTVTAGIISAKGRRTGLSDGTSFEDFLQTDAPINRGNSGGALVNLSGELIGINSQILSPGGSAGGNIGIGFAIPSNMARSVMEQLLKDGKVRRGKLGIGIQNLTVDTAKAMDLGDTAGVLVNSVSPGSAAEKAGIKRGDVITAINGEKIEDTNVLRNKVAGTPPGTEIRLTIFRNGGQQEVTATLDEFDLDEVSRNSPGGRDEDAPAGKPAGKLGLSLQPISPQIAKQLGISSNEGLVVTAVDPDGAASDAGIAPGDVILEINRQAVSSVDQVQAAIENSGSKPVLLLISRRDQTIFLTVRTR